MSWQPAELTRTAEALSGPAQHHGTVGREAREWMAPPWNVGRAARDQREGLMAVARTTVGMTTKARLGENCPEPAWGCRWSVGMACSGKDRSRTDASVTRPAAEDNYQPTLRLAAGRNASAGGRNGNGASRTRTIYQPAEVEGERTRKKTTTNDQRREGHVPGPRVYREGG